MSNHIHVIVRFPKAFPLDMQGPFLLRMEKLLRLATEIDIRVVKDLMGDDSKLRIMMTKEMRDRL